MGSFDRIISAREEDAEYLRDWIREIENENWKSVRRSGEGTTETTEETLAWLRRQLDAAESQVRMLRGEDDRSFPGEDAAAAGVPPENI